MVRGKWSHFLTLDLEFKCGNEAMWLHVPKTLLRRSTSSLTRRSLNDRLILQMTKSTRSQTTSVQTKKYSMKPSTRSGLWETPAKKLKQEPTSTSGQDSTALCQATSALSRLKNRLLKTKSCWRKKSSQRQFWRGSWNSCQMSSIPSTAPEAPKRLNLWLRRISYILPRRTHFLSRLFSSTKISSKKKVPLSSAGNVQFRFSTQMNSAILNNRTKAELLSCTKPQSTLRNLM